MTNRNSLTSFLKNVLKISTLSLLLAGGCASKPVDKRSFAFWPSYPEEPRILFLKAYSADTDVEPPKSAMDIIIYGKQDAPPVPITHPYGLAMWNGRIYVCDTRSANIEILDIKKRQMQLMGTGDSGKMVKPLAIAIANDGTKYVADNQMQSIVVFDASDKYVRSFGHKDFYPVGLAVHGNEIYAVDHRASHIEVFDRNTGAQLRIIGSPGQKPGQLLGPLGIAVDEQGNVYVDDVLNCRVQKFTAQGKFIGAFGARGDSPGAFTRPKHLAVDHDGVIYVVDAAFQNVQMFDKQFRPLMYFGSAGNHPGAMDMPAGISVREGDVDLFASQIPDYFQAQRLILVTNQFGDGRVAVYAMGHLKPGHSVNELSGSKDIVPAGTATRPTSGPGAALPEADSH
jgi:DNA-binding beta-propeller fold protein YncE